MKKLFSIVALAAFATFAFTSCDKDKDKTDTSIAAAVAGDYSVYCDITVTPNEKIPTEEGGMNFTDLPATLKVTKVTDTSVKYVLSGLKLPGSDKEIPMEITSVTLAGTNNNATFEWEGELKFSIDGENEDTGDADMTGSIVTPKDGTMEASSSIKKLSLSLDLVVADKTGEGEVVIPGYTVKVVMDNEKPAEE